VNSENESNSEQVWESGWEDHRQKQLERLAKLPLSEKLAWLEEAHRLVRNLEQARANESKKNGG
jgi:hypothetical protein